jgi:hypothetical protein
LRIAEVTVMHSVTTNATGSMATVMRFEWSECPLSRVRPSKESVMIAEEEVVVEK